MRLFVLAIISLSLSQGCHALRWVGGLLESTASHTNIKDNKTDLTTAVEFSEDLSQHSHLCSSVLSTMLRRICALRLVLGFLVAASCSSLRLAPDPRLAPYTHDIPLDAPWQVSADWERPDRAASPCARGCCKPDDLRLPAVQAEVSGSAAPCTMDEPSDLGPAVFVRGPRERGLLRVPEVPFGEVMGEFLDLGARRKLGGAREGLLLPGWHGSGVAGGGRRVLAAHKGGRSSAWIWNSNIDFGAGGASSGNRGEDDTGSGLVSSDRDAAHPLAEGLEAREV